jgi:hypothetical protein
MKLWKSLTIAYRFLKHCNDSVFSTGCPMRNVQVRHRIFVCHNKCELSLLQVPLN